MIKKYNVTVNGKAYQVEVEEVGASYSSPAPKAASQAAAPIQTPAPAARPAPAPTPAPAAAPILSAGASTISSPMPGTITSIKVKPGDAVKKGDVLLILEAMKMENDIQAVGAGTVAAIHVNAGAAVNTGDALVSIQ